MNHWNFPALFTATEEGGYVITFRDLPEAITQWETLDGAITAAMDCLDEAIARRIDDGLNIPIPSRPAEGERPVALPAQMVLKAILYVALRDAGITKAELARRIGVNEKEVRRMLDPRHGTKLPALEAALRALGMSLVLEARDAA